ncbi:MAG: hypothetical protein LBN94_01725 [Puniceicoccales bacterium]|nr:hypothetical protein [Puniceicoccales bacterium]
MSRFNGSGLFSDPVRYNKAMERKIITIFQKSGKYPKIDRHSGEKMVPLYGE